MTDAAVKRLAARLIGLEAQVRTMSQPQLSHSTVEGGAIELRDGAGGLVGYTGTLPDGSGGTLAVNGPQPPRPTAPVVVPVPGGLAVTWDGYFADDAQVPYTFARVEVHVGPTPDFFTGSATYLRGSISTSRGGTVTVVPLAPGQAHYAVLVAWTASGRASVASAQVSGTPDDVVSAAELKEASDTAAAARAAADQAEASATNALGTAEQAQGVADAAQSSATAASSSADRAKSDAAAAANAASAAQGTANTASSKADTAQGAANQAQSSANTAINTANGKGRAYYQASAPGAGAPSDVWFHTGADNLPHRWVDGQGWVAQPLGNNALFGNIDAAKMTVGFLAAARIATDTIEARMIRAGQILAGHVGADQIRAGHILAGEIVAGHIRSNQIYAGHIVAGEIKAGHLSADSINGKEITGAYIRTGRAYAPESRIELVANDFYDGGATLRFFDSEGNNGGTIYSRNRGTIIRSAYNNLGLTVMELMPDGGVIFDIWGIDGSGGNAQVQLHPFAAQFYPPIVPHGHIIMKTKTVFFREHGGNDKLAYEALRNGPRLTGQGAVEIYVAGYSTSAVAAYASSAGEWRVATRVYANSVQLSSRSATKRKVKDVGKGLQAIRALKPRQYERHLDAHGEPLPTPQQEQGFILEEVRDVMPEVVGRDEAGEDDALDVMGMLTVLTKAVQELDAKVNPAPRK